ncbi:sulfotransferase family protein [Candidatus Entotheonella palauensis]|uniref:sulfotransferase family protein n=1 Tax=Candidatus Entotheonella palauensis TaxID=93172 RepID=UPI000B7D0B1E|nr:sulfotransferase [Candidatus Entotheonella palauensis]
MNTPIFVVGTPRSGTTLTARILGRHSGLFIPGETHFFDDIYARRQELGEPREARAAAAIAARLSTLYQRFNEPDDQQRIQTLGGEEALRQVLGTSCRTYGDVLCRFMQFQMCQNRAKVRWGNHVPKDIFYVRDILKFYPEAKFVICVRDIRDFLFSYQYQWKKTSPENIERMKKLYHPVLTSLLWKAAMKQIRVAQELVPPDNLLIIRYEDLAIRPEATIHTLCQFLKESYEEEMLQVEAHNSSFEVQAQGIFSTSIQRWRQHISHEEVYIGERLARPELQQLGYPITHVQPNPLKLLHIAASFPYAFCRALYANRSVRGPMLPYLKQRAASFFTSGKKT